MKPDIAAVIFDCDGTLVDSEGPGLDVMHELARDKGVAVARHAFHARFRGVRMAETVGWIATQAGLQTQEVEADWIREIRAAQAARYSAGLDSLPGAHDLLGRMVLPFCVATNGPREKVELTLAVAGLRHYFGDRVFSAYEVGSFKPAPGLFLHAARSMDIAPAQCAVVEDSLPGIEAGLAAGMRVITLHPRAELPAGLVEQIDCIRHLGELEAFLPVRGKPY